jgi:adenosylcobinamide-GDP ribazoletransferase
VTSLLRALRYLTIVPVPGGGEAAPETLGRSAAWFPVAGLAIGLVLVAVDRLAALLFPGLLAALLTVTAWKLLTGGLHLDGLADCLDGLMGADREQRLAIMHDSRIGAFGAIGLILFLLLEIAAVAELVAPTRWRALLVTPVIARALPPLLGRLHPPARPAGQGAMFLHALPARAAPIALGTALVVAAAGLGVAGIAALGAGTLAAVALTRFLAGRLGGITGDVLGAAVETAELTSLLTMAAWQQAAW